MGGIEATKHIRKQFSEQYIPIIAMTANAMDEHKEQCLAAGMDSFISKPIDKTFLQKILMEYL